MAISKELKDAARACYVYEHLPAPAIARRLGLTEHSVHYLKRRAGAKGDDWDNARSALKLSRKSDELLHVQVLEDFIGLFKSTMDALRKDTNADPLKRAQILASLADAFAKTKASVRTLTPTINKLSIALEVIELLAKFITASYPDKAATLIEVLEPFGGYLQEHMRDEDERWIKMGKR